MREEVSIEHNDGCCSIVGSTCEALVDNLEMLHCCSHRNCAVFLPLGRKSEGNENKALHRVYQHLCFNCTLSTTTCVPCENRVGSPPWPLWTVHPTLSTACCCAQSGIHSDRTQLSTKNIEILPLAAPWKREKVVFYNCVCHMKFTSRKCKCNSTLFKCDG